MNTKAKQKRRNQGKRWVSEYAGNSIIHAYKRKFKIPLIAAINDLEAIGVKLDELEIANVKLDRHYFNKQQLNKKSLEELHRTVQNGEDDLPF